MNSNNGISILYVGLAQFLIVLCFANYQTTNAQCYDDILEVINPGFEGPFPLEHDIPGPWSTCAVTPDTQPGAWNITLPPSEGNSYIGLVNAPYFSTGNPWQEGASQQLSGNMQAGTTYNFTVDLSTGGPDAGADININGFNSLQVYGTNSNCVSSPSVAELLWTSPVITHYGWQTYNVSIQPTQSWSHIYFVTYSVDEYGYTLLDNITQIVSEEQHVFITSHIDGDSEVCDFVLEGYVTEYDEAIDSVLLFGDFQGSPLNAPLSGVDWASLISFNNPGTQTITAQAYYTHISSQNLVETCFYTVEVEIEANTLASAFAFTSQCPNEAVHFTIDSVPFDTSTIASWYWDFGDGNTSTLANPTNAYTTSGIYTVSLEIISNDGCIVASTEDVEVYEIPSANFAFFAQCQGAVSGFGDASAIGSGSITSWSWDFGDGNTSNDQNPGHTFLSSGVYSVQLSVTSNGGCVSEMIKPVTIAPGPLADFYFTGECNETAVSFTDSSVPVGTGNVFNWNWDFGDGHSSTQQSPTHLYSSTGTYTVTLTASANGCSGTSTQDVDVSQYTLADFNFVVECYGTTIAFTDATTPIGTSSIIDWNWDFGDGNTSNLQNPTHVYLTLGTYDVTLQATDSEGCSRALTQTLDLTQSPVADFNFAVECDRTTIEFTDATAPFGTSILTDWNWDFGDGNTSNVQNPTHAFSVSGTYDVTLQVTDSDGCSVTLTQTLNLIESPVADFNFAVVCDGTTIDFTDATVPVGTSIITAWNWDFGDGNTSIVQNPTHDYAGSGTYVVVLEAIDSDGCSRTVSQNLDILESQIADFTYNETCQGGTTNFTDVSTLGMGTVDTWFWDFGDENTSNVQNPNNTYLNAGVYDVQLTVTTTNGCSNSLVQQVEIHAIPVAGFSFGNLCLGEDFQLTDESSPSSSITSWAWDFGNGDVANVQNPTYQYSTEGQYQIKLTVTTGNNCADSIAQSVSVYPAPTADFSWTDACLSDPLTFADASFSVGSSISQWEWNYGDNNGVSNQQNPTYIYASSGLFEVELIATTPNGCKDTVTHTVEVFDLPVADFAFTNVCELDSVLFNNFSVTTQGVIDSWAWNFGDGESSLDTAPSHLYQTYGIYPVQLTVVTNQGCTDTATSNVEIHPLPTVSFVADVTEGCQPLVVNYQENVTLPAPHTIFQYQWNFGNGVEANVQQPPSISYSDSTLTGFDVQQFTVSLRVVTDNGCVASDTMENYITIFPSPVADFITTADTAQTSTSTFNFIDASSDNVYNWYWEFGDGETANEQNQTHTYPYSQTITEFDVILTVETRSGCIDTAMATVLVDNEFTFYIPNTITPNGDGVNDFFTPKGTGFKTYTTSIYTRWGEEIFYSEDPEHRWDGTYKGSPVEQGVFVYRIELKHFSNRVNAYVGNVNVLR